MSDMRASVTIELIDRFTREGQQAARTLADIARSADQLGREGSDVARAGRDVERGVEAMGRGAGRADQALNGLGREMADLERGIESWMRANDRADTSLDGLARAARGADQATGALGRDSRRSSDGVRAIGRSAGHAADEFRDLDRNIEAVIDSSGRLRNARGQFLPGGGLGPRVPVGLGGIATGGLGYGGLAGAGGAFIGGAGLGVAGGAAGAGAIVGAAINGATQDEFEADQLRILAGQSEEEFAARDTLLKKAGRDYGIGTGGAYSIYGGLLQGGMDDAGAAALLDPVVVMAKATRAELDDVTATAMAMTNNLQLAPERMMEAFDAMALGAKEGAFEVRDMAQSFPTLAAQMGLIGYRGMEGVKSITAMAEIVRTVSGTSAEAGNNVENFLAKVTAPDFVENARELGVNIQETMEAARTEGVDPLFAVLERLKRATGGDAEKLSALVPDRQANIALNGLLSNLEEYQAKMDRMDDAGGTVMKDYEEAIGNAQSAWDRFYSRVSGNSKDLAANTLQGVAKALDGVSSVMDAAEDRQGGLLDTLGGWMKAGWNLHPVALAAQGLQTETGQAAATGAAGLLFGQTSAERRAAETENAYLSTVGAPVRPAPAPIVGASPREENLLEAMRAADRFLPQEARAMPSGPIVLPGPAVAAAPGPNRPAPEPSSSALSPATGTGDLASARIGAAFDATAAEGSAELDAFLAKLRGAESDASSAGQAAGQAAGDGVGTGFAAASDDVLAQAQALFAKLRSVFSAGVTVPVRMGATPAAAAPALPTATEKSGRVTGARATGGPVAGGNRYLVGEAGPEIVEFEERGIVHPAHRTASLMRPAGTIADARASDASIFEDRPARPAASTGRGSQPSRSSSQRAVNVTINVNGAGDPNAVAARLGRSLETKLAGILGDVGIG